MKRLFSGDLPFWRRVLTLASGTVGAQVLALATTPILTRLYLPEAFGLFGAYLAVVLILSVVANGGYELAIMLPKTEREANLLVLLCVGIAVGLALLTLLVGLGLSPDWLSRANLVELNGWHLLLPLSLLIKGINQPLLTMLNRYRDYRTLSVSQIAKTLAQVILSLVLGWWGAGFEGLLIGFLCGQIAGLVVLLTRYVPLVQQTGWSFSGLGQLCRRYADFPVFAVLSNWLNTAAKQLPAILLPGMYADGKAAAGHFAQTQKLLALPIAMLGGSGRQCLLRAGQPSLAGKRLRRSTPAHLAYDGRLEPGGSASLRVGHGNRPAIVWLCARGKTG